MALNFEKQAIKEQGYIEGFVNDIGIKILIDTAAEITLTSKEMFDKIAEKPLLSECNSKLYTANCTSSKCLSGHLKKFSLNCKLMVICLLLPFFFKKVFLRLK